MTARAFIARILGAPIAAVISVSIILMAGCKAPLSALPVSDPTGCVIPGNAESACLCNEGLPLVEPDKGEECPLPWGLDVRFLAWSPDKGDWVFIGFYEASATYSDGKITGNDFVKNGKCYTYEGQRQRSSSSAMITNRAVEFKPTHRVYFEARKAQ